MLNREISTKLGLIILSVVFFFCGGVLLWTALTGDLGFSYDISFLTEDRTSSVKKAPVSEIKTFSSAEELKEYLSEHQGGVGYGVGGGIAVRTLTAPASNGETMAQDIGLSYNAVTEEKATLEKANRISETNVQVVGIDEPDIIKTDGKEIYYSRQGGYTPWLDEPTVALGRKETFAPYYLPSRVSLINAFPPAEMKTDGVLEQGGDLLLFGNLLIVLSDDKKITAYDVSDKASPSQKWSMKLDDREYMLNARLMDGKIYLITRRNVDYVNPCPIKPFSEGQDETIIACGDIHYVEALDSADVTYNLIALDAVSGEVKNKTAFLGNYSNSVFYMSENAAYLTYSIPADYVEMTDAFFTKNSDLVPEWVIAKLKKLKTYDLSANAKMAELSDLLQKFLNSLNDDDVLKFENEISNRLESFLAEHRREINRTGIAKFSLKDFSVITGAVPGSPLNQFSLDEYDNHLRIAVTIGQSWFVLGGFGTRGETVSDVYVLNNDLEITGAVKDLGETERIYSARFIGDRGYIVTFRQTDPFYVLDLSNPNYPVLRGELKIPGFSSYLHSLGNHRVLGIGRDGSKVKLSIFDATHPEDPKEAAKYTLNEYWSEALQNHHAFLLDAKHQIFFMPGAKGGYVFSYKNDELKLEAAVSQDSVKRAIYLDDFLYVVGDEQITVLDEKTWEVVKEFEF